MRGVEESFGYFNSPHIWTVQNMFGRSRSARQACWALQSAGSQVLEKVNGFALTCQAMKTFHSGVVVAAKSKTFLRTLRPIVGHETAHHYAVVIKSKDPPAGHHSKPHHRPSRAVDRTHKWEKKCLYTFLRTSVGEADNHQPFHLITKSFSSQEENDNTLTRVQLKKRIGLGPSWNQQSGSFLMWQNIIVSSYVTLHRNRIKIWSVVYVRP